MDPFELRPVCAEPAPDMLPVGESCAPYLRLLEESDRRAAELVILRASVEDLREQHQAESAAQAEHVLNARAMVGIARAGQRRAEEQLKVTARGVCPILREYLLIVGALPLASLTHDTGDNKRNAREMLVLLEPFERA